MKNLLDVLFMRNSGRIKTDSNILDILFWKSTNGGGKRVLFPSTNLYPSNSIYPTSLDVEINENK